MSFDLKNLEYEDVLKIMEQNGYFLKYLENQTPDACLKAVKQNGLALQYANYRTLEICFEAVKQNGEALQFVDKKNQTELVITIALKRIDDNKKIEFCKEAIKDETVRKKTIKEIENHLKFSEITADIAKNRGIAL